MTCLPDSKPIAGLDDAAKLVDVKVFHAGTTRRDDGALVSSGGRVLCVTALGDSVRVAQQRAYEALQPITLAGAQWRRDIGHRAVKPR